MPAFQSAQNFVLCNPVFTDHNTYYQSHTGGIDVLRESSAPEAAFDSDSRRYAPSCFPGTRLQYIEDILNWATAPSTFPIYRMTGPAGVGKSAIAQTCAEELRSQHRLGASFFFTIHGCYDYSRLFPSISYQLSSKSPDYHELLNRKLQLDPTLVRKRLLSQFRELIVEPLWELEQAGKPIGKSVILIDGLDECKDKDAQREIIEIVVSSTITHNTPFSWLFFSRPEPQIESAFAGHRAASLCISAFLSVSCGIDGEIKLYIQSGLQDILRRRGITTSNPWPSEQDMHTLVSASQGLYIYAATILRFVGRTDTHYDPLELLGVIVKGCAQGSNSSTIRSPFEELDAFYTLILERVPNELHSSVQLFLCLMVFSQMVVKGALMKNGVGMRLMANTLRITEAKAKMLCGELIAVIYYANVDGGPVASQGLGSADVISYQEHPASSTFLSPLEEVYNREEWLEFHHKSFFDFLCDPLRSGPFCVTTPNIRNKLFEYLVKFQINYSRMCTFQSNNGLILANNESNVVTEVHDVLSWPLTSEILNPTVRALVFELVGTLLVDKFFPYDDLDDQLLRRFVYVDHRKYLMIQSWTFKDHIPTLGSNLGFNCMIRNVQGTILCWTTHRQMLSFDVEKFRRGVLRLESAQVIQRYNPSSTNLELPLFQYDSDGNALSGLYIKGRGQMSTFWYWWLDPEMRYYREFETADLSKGERVFREETFRSTRKKTKKKAVANTGTSGAYQTLQF